MIGWHIEKRKIKDLKPHPKNPRKLSKHDAAHLQKSLEKFGIIDKPIITPQGQIIGGHQRLSILKKMGHKEIECYVPDQVMSEQDIDELNIRLNRATGEWDFDILANQWDSKLLVEWGFTPEELCFETPEPLAEDESEVLEPGKDEDAITKPGDVYDLGDHRLGCGDSTNADFVHFVVQQNTLVLIITDPPYGINLPTDYKKRGRGKLAKCRNYAPVFGDDKPFDPALLLSINLPTILWGANWFSSRLPDSGGWLVWDKERPDDLDQATCELAWTNFVKGVRIFNYTWHGMIRKGDDILEHPTQKPVELIKWCLNLKWTPTGNIYDPFLGSGTTLLAAEQLNRKCYGIEISPAYCDIIVKRWIKYRQKCGKDAKVIVNGRETKAFETVGSSSGQVA